MLGMIGTGVDRISDLLGYLAAAIFFLIGLMITFEVVSRYIFLAPTTWAEEGARLLQLWATYGALAYILKTRAYIRITALIMILPLRLRQFLEFFALLWIMSFSVVVIWYGYEIARESVEVGRATETMNQVPMVWTEAAIPIGFSLLVLQGCAELYKLFKHGTLDRSNERGELGSEFH
tara:strand:- start:172 stop:705 length:534 start_codon:yes stop_codon:yes gene_type:complete